MRSRIRLWLLLAVPIAAIYWWQADWWAYVDRGPHEGWDPKFEMPLWWQIVESSLAGGGSAFILLWARNRITARRPPDREDPPPETRPDHL